MLNKIVKFAVLPVALILIWEAAVRFGAVPAVVLAPPSAVVASLVSLFRNGGILGDLSATLARTAISCTLATVIGVFAGMAAGRYGVVRETTLVPVEFMRSVPTTSLLPALMLFLGIGFRTEVALATLPCLWIMFMSAMYGVRNSSQVRRDMAKAFGASALFTFFEVTLPDALPHLVAGFRIAISTALHMAIVAEMFTGSSDGLGRRLLDAQLYLRVPEMYAIIVLAGILGYLLNVVWLPLEKGLAHWIDK